jgi:hypothetical protein
MRNIVTTEQMTFSQVMFEALDNPNSGKVINLFTHILDYMDEYMVEPITLIGVHISEDKLTIGYRTSVQGNEGLTMVFQDDSYRTLLAFSLNLGKEFYLPNS